MTFSRPQIIGLLTAFSVCMILGAWAFEFIGGMAPCKLCYYQRYPHWLAAGAGGLALLTGAAVFLYAGAIGAALSGLIGLYHSGVERKWWEGPTTCTSGDIGSLNADELFNQIMAAPLVRCDDIPWELFGMSMANYNAIFSLVAAFIWIRMIVKS